ncbi:hypothetical protein OsJ_11281 [Oryza sativa Japonica Group]|uniref:Reverse transcriptase domain-containing protein n=1 Tax=Oryza sativa subsp. japonica TaxID=39947 RepID=B9F914_ORYSJ|nr:hypothetical protein OsJ_11281 [Oryza sativa Japonica Group]
MPKVHVADQLQNLNLTTEEENVAEFSDDDETGDPQEVEWMLVGKVLSPAIVHATTVFRAMKPARGNPYGLKIRSIDEKADNIFVTKFKVERDLQRALGGSPWMNLEPPTRLDDKHRGELAMGLVGVVRKLEVDSDGKASGPYLRGRVAIVVAKSLRRGMLLKTKKDAAPEWFYLQYEKLPYYCLACGIVGHLELEYEKPVVRYGSGKLPYDIRLRAPEIRKKKLLSFQAAVAESFGSGSSGGSKQPKGSSLRSKDGRPKNPTYAMKMMRPCHLRETRPLLERRLLIRGWLQIVTYPRITMKILRLCCEKGKRMGLGQLEAVQEVHVVVFLSETRCFSNKVQGLRSSLSFPNGIGVGTYGCGGGLALLWNNEVCVKLQSYDKLHIDVMVVDPVSEVDRALSMMGAHKAPGPDSFTVGFYQAHWETIGPSVTRAVLNFLNGGELPEAINQTTLVLTPKVKHPQDLKNFRPISLCNVVYKLCSKVLANRLRVFLDEIISAEQSAFVPGRLITDNVLVAYECTHYLKRKKGKTGACAVKLDMAKA